MDSKKQIIKGSSKLLVLTLAFLFLPASTLFSQEKDVKSEFEKEFEQFKKSIQEDFITFKTRNDSVFSAFLKNAWKEYDLSTEVRKTAPKPVVQPVIRDTKVKSQEIVPSHRKTMMEDTARQLRLNNRPVEFNTTGHVPEGRDLMEMDFYGTQIQIPAARNELPVLQEVSAAGISAYFDDALENEDLYDIISDAYAEVLARKLNGWGLMKLLQTTSEKIYTSANDRVLFTWFGLLKCKRDAKVGYDESNVYLLAAFDTPVFYRSYFQAGDIRYYLIRFDGQEEISEKVYSYDNVHPGAKKLLSLQFRSLPDLAPKAVAKEYMFNNSAFEIAYDSNIVNYYKNYPDCDISVYFQPTLTEEAFNSLDKFIEPNLEGKDLTEKVNFLLAFVQKAFSYETDDEQFGRENYLFAEEMLSYGTADCEDRSVFLAQLIDHYLRLRYIGLEYPGHFTLAVNVPGNPEGYYLVMYDDRYYVCDPTYIGAKMGMLMPQFENIQPELIEF
jgi:hypothetical protein